MRSKVHTTHDRQNRERLAAREMLARRIVNRAEVPATLQVSLGPRYTELEAEVEAEGAHVSRGWLRAGARSNSLRLESSLTDAIELSAERFILLEGEPGAGKTVALHRVERSFAQRILQQPDSPLPMPLCVKLRHVAPDGGKPLDRLRACVLQSLDPDPIDAARLFDEGARGCGWLLLLDGFDEIPGVLSAIEVTGEIRAYALAIQALCEEVCCDSNRACRVVVATRQYHGPTVVGWSRFRLRPLSVKVRRDFIANFALTAEQVTLLNAHLAIAPVEVQQWADNPLMLAMLCEVIQDGHEPPANVYELFERYLERRFTRDASRIRERYGGSVARLRRTAEDIGFVMSAERGLGIAPTTAAIRTALVRHGLPTEDLARAVEAINSLELVLRDEGRKDQHTAFGHRRLQEYFATSVLLREPDRLAPEQLLFDAQWREASVVLLQRGSLSVLELLLASAEEALRGCHAELDIPVIEVDPTLPREEAMVWVAERLRDAVTPKRIRWSLKAQHLLGLMQAGFAYRRDLPTELQQLCILLLTQVYQAGTRIDKKAVLEVIGVLPAGFLEGFVLAALDSNSELLQDLAFKQLPRLGTLSPGSERQVSRLLVRMARQGSLIREREATRARIRRTGSGTLERSFEMACLALVVDRVVRSTLFCIYLLTVAIVASITPMEMGTAVMVVGLFLVPPLLALTIRDNVRIGSIIIRVGFDLLTWMFVTLFAAVVAKNMGFGIIGAFAVPFVWIYVYSWAPIALLSVWLQVAVPKPILPLLPLVLVINSGGGRLRPILVMLGIAMGSMILSGVMPDLPKEWGEGVATVVIVPLYCALLAGGALLTRRVWAHGVDWYRRRAFLRTSRALNGATLRAELAKFRTPPARIRILQEVLRDRHVTLTLDDATRADLDAFLIALETHSAVVDAARKRSFRDVVMFRIPFPAQYTADVSEHRRWCLDHCRSPEAVGELTTMIDLLTRLLDRAEQAGPSNTHGSA